MSDSDEDIADAEKHMAAMMAIEDPHVPLEKDEEIDSCETVDEAADWRDRTCSQATSTI